MKPDTARNILLILLTLLASGALFGGGVLIISPSGQLFSMPLSLIENSPFGNFLIPGIILFTVLGIVPLLLVYALLRQPEYTFAEILNLYKDMHWSWTYSIYVAFALMIWIQVEMMFIYSIHWSYNFYLLLATGIILVALLPQIRERYKK